MPDHGVPSTGRRRAQTRDGRGAIGLRTIRDRPVGLPLQKSTFRRLPEGLGVIGFEGRTPGFPLAMMGKDGDIFADIEAMAREASRFADELSEESVFRLDERLRSSVDALEVATKASHGPEFADVRAALVDLGNALEAFMPLPLLAKVYATALLDTLRARGFDGPPPVPSPSPGALLSMEMADLVRMCSAEGVEPESLPDVWPRVPPRLSDAIERFAADHVGYGPLAWEAPGLEDPALVVRMMAVSASPVRELVPARPVLAPSFRSPFDESTYLALRTWIDISESGISRVRRAFHMGIRPRLRPFASGLGLDPVDILFATFDELADGMPPEPVLADRRRSYGGAADYLTRNGVAADRLWAMVPG